MEKKEIRKPFFEDTSVGKLKRRIYNMSDKEIDRLLKEYEIPSTGEMEKPGSYIQNTIRKEVVGFSMLVSFLHERNLEEPSRRSVLVGDRLNGILTILFQKRLFHLLEREKGSQTRLRI